jgi:SAM-dependent methyltransferase
MDTQIRLRNKGMLVAEDDLDRIQKYVQTGTMLEVGCGAGHFLYSARRRGFDVTGVEFNRKFVEFASDQLGLKVLPGTVADVDFLAGSFDVAYLRNVLSHMADPIGDFRIIRSWVKDNGYLFVETGNFPELADDTIRRMQTARPLGIPDHMFFFSEKHFRSLMEMTGFDMVSKQEFSTVFHDWFYNVIEDRAKRTLRDVKPGTQKSSFKEKFISRVWYFSMYGIGSALPKNNRPCTVKYVCRAKIGQRLPDDNSPPFSTPTSFTRRRKT